MSPANASRIQWHKKQKTYWERRMVWWLKEMKDTPTAAARRTVLSGFFQALKVRDHHMLTVHKLQKGH